VIRRKVGAKNQLDLVRILAAALADGGGEGR
jgi:hypothetical protein